MPECRAGDLCACRPWRGCVRNENHPGWHRDGLGYQWPPTVTPGRCMDPSTMLTLPGQLPATYCNLLFGHKGAHTDGTSHWTRTNDGSLPTPAGIMTEEQFSRMIEALNINLAAAISRSPGAIMRAQLDAMAEELREAKHEIKILKESEDAEVKTAEWQRELAIKANVTLIAKIEKLERKIRKLKEDR